MKKSRVFGILSSVFVFLFLFSTCEIGLGASVDTEAPALSVTIPSAEKVTVLRGDFPVRGNYKDDGSIASVDIVLKQNDKTAGEYQAEITPTPKVAGEGTWSTVISPDEAGIPDGSYSVEITISDKAGHKTSSVSQIVIDNTAPIIVLTRPSTKEGSSSPDTYGQTFSLEGQAADDNNVSLIEVQIYSDADCTNLVHTVPLKNVPNSINMDVAKFVKDDVENDYYKIYGSSTTDAGEKQLYCKIIAYDGAEHYPEDGSEQTDEDKKGNSTEEYYLYKDISTSILQNYKITEVYEMLNGTYAGSDSSRAAASLNVRELLNQNVTKKGFFALNPKNNPTFSVTGQSPLAMDGTDFTGTAHNISNGQSVVVEVSPGLDGILLDESSLKVYARLCDAKGVENTSAAKIYMPVKMAASGTSYRFTATINLSDGFKIGQNYVFGVEGYDQSEAKNPILPSGKAYGFHMATTGKAPTLVLTNPASTTTYIGKNNAKQTFSGSITVEAGTPVLTIYNGSSVVKQFEFTESQAQEVDAGLQYSFSYEYTAFGNSSAQYNFKVDAVQDTLNTSIERTVVYDRDPPDVNILSTSPVVDNILKYKEDDESGNPVEGNKYLNGNVDFTVAVVDDFDVVNASSVIWNVLKDDKVIKSAVISNPTRESFTLNTTEFDEGNITLKIAAADRAGNSIEESYNYIIDQKTDIPVILPGDSDSITFLNDTIAKYNAQTGTKKGIATVGSTLVFKLHDDDGLKSITIKNSKNSINSDSDTVTEWEDYSQKESERSIIEPHSLSGTDTTFSYMLPTDGGYYKFNVVVEDKNGTKNEKTFVLNVTKAAAEIKTVSPDRKYAKSGLKIKNAIKIVESQEPYIITRTIGSNTEKFENLSNSAFSDDGFIDEIDVKSLLQNGANTVSYHIKDGNERDGNTLDVILTRDDLEPEKVVITSPAAGRTGNNSLTDISLTFGGTLNDKDSEIEKLWYYFAKSSSGEFTPPEDSNYQKIDAANGSFGIPMVFDERTAEPESGHLCEGKYTLYIKAEDKAGNITANPVSVRFDVDRNPPKINAATITETASTKLSGNVYYFNGALTGSASASDTAGSADITIKLGNEEKTADWNGSTWTLGADQFKDNELQTLTIIATDSVGKTADKAFSIYKDVTGPSVTPTNPGTVFAVPTINGSVTDNNGVGVASILWSNNGTDYSPVSSYTGGRNDWSYKFTSEEFGNAEGERTYYFKAKDALGNEGSVLSVTFNYDANIPEVIIGGSYTENKQYYAKSGFTLEGKAWDTNLLSEVIITQNGSPVSDVNLTGAESGKSSENAATWSKTFTTGTSTGGALADGAYTFKISAKDSADRSSQEISRNIIVDTVAPVVTLTGLPGKQDTKNKGYTFTGSASDATSGVKEVKLTISNGTETHTVTVDGTTRWSYTLDCASEEWKDIFGENGDGQGVKYVYVSATDEAGLSSTGFTYTKDSTSYNDNDKKLSFIYDTADPVLSINESGFIEYMPASGLTVSGSATDTYPNGALTLTITEKKDGNETAESKNAEKNRVTIGSDGSFTKTLPLSGSVSSDCKYTYQFVLKDVVGNTVYSKEFNTTVDRTAPTVTITTPKEDSTKTGINAIEEASYKFEGGVTEENSLSGIYYAIKKKNDSAPAAVSAGIDALDSSKWTENGFTGANAGTASWNFYQQFNSGTTDESGKLSEGQDYTLYVYAVDKAGNVSTQQSRKFDVDLSAPAVTSSVTKNTYNSTDLSSNSGSFDVTGTASDTYGLASVIVHAKKSDGTEKTLTVTLNSDNWSQTFIFGSSANTNAENYLAEGKYEIWAVATDFVGKSTLSDKLQVTIDYTAPEIDESSLLLNKQPFKADNWYESKTIPLSISVNDGTGSGISMVEVTSKPENADAAWTVETAPDEDWSPLSLLNGSYMGTTQLYGSDGEKSFYIRATDIAGNPATIKEISIKIDSSAPELDLYKYQIGNGALSSNAIAFINGEAILTVYGTYSDSQSGVQELKFTGTKNDAQPTVTYSTKTVTDSIDDDYEEFAEENKTNIKSWKAVFTNGDSGIITTGDLKVTGYNNSGTRGLQTEKKLFTLNRDITPPTLSNLNITGSSTKYSVYKTADNSYYVNNTDGKFTITGLAEDPVPQNGQASGVAKVELTISGLAADKQPASSSTAYFKDLDLTSLSGDSVLATLTVTDNAGNSSSTSLTINFDVTGPVGKHEIDNKGKDLYFRFGEQNRADDDGKSGSTWTPSYDAALDDDVGGKYSPDTYGNLGTLKIRGKFDDSGSGLALIYYKLFTTEPSENDLNQFLSNYKSENNGYFSPLSANETRRVFYTNESGVKTYIEVESSYKTTIAGLSEGQNYLVLLAVDNVGNAKIDEVKIDESTYKNYRINVDQTLPVVSADSSEVIYTNAETNETVSGTYIDDAAWLKKLTINIGSNAIPASSTSDAIANVSITKDGTSFTSDDLKGEKYSYLKKGSRIKIDDNYYYVTDVSALSTSGQISFTPVFASETGSYSVYFGSGTWSAVIPADTLKTYADNGRSVTVSAVATDNAGSGNTTTEPSVATIVVDRTYPEVTIDSINSIINKDVKFTVNASDRNPLSAITLQYKKKSESDTAWKTYASITSDSETLNNPHKWEITVDTADSTKFDDDTDYDFRAYAKDLAGNEGNAGTSRTASAYSSSKVRSAKVSQDSDRPVIKITDLTLPATAGLTIACPVTDLSFTISDDDGAITAENVSYQLTAITNGNVTEPADSGWIDSENAENKLTYTNGSFVLKNLTQGEQALWFKIIDSIGTTFASDNSSESKLTSPRITDSSANNTVYSANTALKLKVDTQAPEISDLKFLRVSSSASYSSTDWNEESKLSSQVFGGPDSNYQNKFKLSLYAYDANTVTSVKLTVPSSDGDVSGAVYEYEFTKAETTVDGLTSAKNVNGNNYDLWVSPEISVEKFVSSSRTGVIEVTEGVKPRTVNVTLNIDNTPPHLGKNFTPTATEPVVGEVKVRGEVADNDGGSGFSSTGLKYYIPKSSETNASSVADSNWTEPTSPGSSTWQIVLSDLNSLLIYDSENETVSDDYKNYGNDLDGLYSIPIWFRLEDKAGNVGYDTSSVKILYNPNADKPMVAITEPVHDTPADNPTYVIAGGKFKIRGSAKDNVGINGVYLQFDMDGDGIYENGNGITGAPTLNLVNIPNKKTNGVQERGVLASGTDNWSYDFDAISLTDNITMKVRAISVDRGHDTDKNLYSSWTPVLNIIIENVKPQFSEPELRKYSSAFTEGATAAATTSAADNYIAQKNYQKNMYIKESNTEGSEHWYVYGEIFVKSENYITEVSTTGSNIGSWKGAAGTKTSQDGIISWSDNAGVTQKYLIPIERVNTNSWETTVTAKGKNTTDSKNENEYTLNITIDNNAPIFSDKNAAADIASLGEIKLYKDSYGGKVLLPNSTGENALYNKNALVTITGKVEEDGSGFEKLAFFFKRGDKIYSVKENYNCTFETNSDGLPVLKGTAVVNTDGIRADSYKVEVSGISANKNIRKGGLVKIGGVYRKITDKTGDVVTFDTECKTSFTDVEFVYAMVVDSSKENLKQDYSIGDDDGDGMYENFSNVGNYYTWEVAVDSKNIPDGPIEIGCVVFDNAGNITAGNTKTYISNNPPRITSVMLGTDLNADTKYDLSSEFDTFYYSQSDNGIANKKTGTDIWNLDAKKNNGEYWTAKKDLVVIPEFVGGNGSIYYTYSKKTGSAGAKLTVAENLVESDSAKLITAHNSFIGELPAAEEGNTNGALVLVNGDTDTLGYISTTGDYEKGSNDGLNVYRFSFWDSTAGCTVGTDSQWSLVNITMKQDLSDGTAPTGEIIPFYWKSKADNDNSVQWDSSGKALGHIELPSDLPNGTFKDDSGEYDRDPKVSGKIEVEGTAYDETMLKTITVTFDNKSVKATYSSSTGWTYATNSDDFKLTVTDANGPTQEGHSVTWLYEVDTSKASAVAATDRVIKVEVTDASSANSGNGNANTVGTTQTGGTDGTGTKTPYYKVDVVPYITEVTTNLSSFNRNKPSVYSRTAIGNYAVRSGESITIKGFNLKNSQNSVVTIGGKNNSFTSTSQSATEITGTVANAATSGELELYASDGTNNIYALNNTNNNDSRGKAASLGSDNSNGYNRQPNGLNNNLLTDDVVLDVYEFTTVATPKNGSISDPFMRINPKTGQPGFCFSNAVLYFNMPGFEQTNTTTYSHTTFGADNGGYVNGTFAWDANGNSFGIATCTDTGWPAESVSTVLFSKRSPTLNANMWNTQQAYKNAIYQRGIESTTICLTEDQPTDSSKYTTDTARVMSPAIATSVSGNTTTLYVAYYDRLTKQVRFRSGTVANDANTIGGALQDIFYRTTNGSTLRGAPDSIYVDGSSKSGTDDSSTTISQNTVTGTSNGRIEIVASKSLGDSYLAAYRNDTTYGPGEYVDIGISGSYVVITWYDSVNRKLMVSYENPSSLQHDSVVATGTLARSGDWQSNAFAVENSTGVGLYVKMAVDPANGIHLAYYNNNGADLKYAYISQSDLTQKKVTKVQTVDAYNNTGARPTIDVTRVADTSVTGGYKYVPYIGYQMNSNLNTTASARVAYPVKFDDNGIPAGDGADSQDMCTGNWEIKTVPTQNTPIDAKVSAGVWTSGTDKVHTAIPSGTDTFENQSATKTINAQATGQRAIIWGNGTLYPVISYAVSEEGKLEMAQMK